MIEYIDERLDILKSQLDKRIKSYISYTSEVNTTNYEINTLQEIAVIQDLKSRIDELTKLKAIAKAFTK
jgi:hypothetical protein